METEINGTGSEQQTDTGNGAGVDSATSGDVRGNDSANGGHDPNSAIAGISRQNRRKSAESGHSSGSEAGSGTAETGSAKTRSRTRSAKTGAKKGTKSGLDLNAEARSALARQVAGIHKLVGIAVGQPQLVAISDDQAETLTNAALDVMQHYDMSVSPVVAAWANLAAVCATIYAPKFLMFNAMRKQARQQQYQAQSQQQPANVFDFSAGGGGYNEQ